MRWGDYPFALSLKKYLERLGCHVIIDAREDWGCEEGADVVLVLRGSFFTVRIVEIKNAFILCGISAIRTW